MKQFMRALKSAPRRTGLFAALAAVFAVPLALHAWGPTDRKTFTYENPADYVTFNSMIGTPHYGDERNFVIIKEAGAANSTYSDSADLTPGKEYTVMVYFHNNAKSSLNSAENNYKGIARNAMMQIQMPGIVKAGQKTGITGTISASNANPSRVWDEVVLNANQGDVALRVVPGSAKISSKGAVNGQVMPNSLFSTGAPLGYSALDGNLPGCNEYAGWVNFNFVVDQPNFSISKDVKRANDTSYSESVAAQPGEEVTFRMQYQNTGTVSQENVTIIDRLPAGLTYVPNSTEIATGNTGGKYGKSSDDNITTRGINIGDFAPKANAYIRFKAKVADVSALKCGVNTITNTAEASTDNGVRKDTAVVTVERKCEEPKDIQVCDLTTKKVITIKENQFDSKKHSKNLDDCKEVPVPPAPKDIQVCDLTTKKVITIKENQFDSKKHSKNLDDCKEVPVPPAPKDIQVCDLTTKKVITIKENQFDSKKHSKNLDDCKEVPVPPAPKDIQVCDLTTKKVITIKENQFDSKKHSKDLNSCEEKPEPVIEVCRVEDKAIVKIKESEFDSTKHSRTTENCAPTPQVPVTPTELPKTGADTLTVIAGLGIVTTLLGYAITSRRS